MTGSRDSRLLVAGIGAANSKYELRQILIVRLTATGTLDPTLGQGGVARPGLQAACGGTCEPMTLQDDGAIVVTGSTGQAVPGHEFERDPPPPRFQWVAPGAGAYRDLAAELHRVGVPA